jgi:CBS-domain-containing membrane protein
LDAANVVDGRGRHRGVITQSDIIAAIVPPAAEEAAA